MTTELADSVEDSPEETTPEIGDMRTDLEPTTLMLWRIFLGLDLAILGWVFLWPIVQTLFLGPPESVSLEPETFRLALYGQSAFVVLLMAVLPALYLAATRVGGWQGVWAHFGLEPRRGVLWGFAVFGATFGLSMIVGLISFAIRGEPAENPQLDAIKMIMTPLLAVALSFSAAVGEEVLFRGFLQRRIGIWLQAVLFGLAHASYGTPEQLIAPFALGLVYGLFYKYKRNLLALMIGHFLYDLLILMVGLYA